MQQIDVLEQKKFYVMQVSSFRSIFVYGDIANVVANPMCAAM